MGKLSVRFDATPQQYVYCPLYTLAIKNRAAAQLWHVSGTLRDVLWITEIDFARCVHLATVLSVVSMDLTASMWIRLDRVTFEPESTFEASSSRRYFLDSAYHIALTLQRNQDVSHESQWQRELRAIIFIWKTTTPDCPAAYNIFAKVLQPLWTPAINQRPPPDDPAYHDYTPLEWDSIFPLPENLPEKLPRR